MIQLFHLSMMVLCAGGNRKMSFEDFENAIEGAQEKLNSLVASIWGGRCLIDNQCARVVGHCDRTKGYSGSLGLDGVCRPTNLVWACLSFILFAILLTCICSLCRCICHSTNRERVVVLPRVRNGRDYIRMPEEVVSN